MSSSLAARIGRSTRRLELALLAALAYVPSLLASPGKVPADTKLYLYLDPARLISDAPYTWDTRQFAGWVPHQNIGYLWPSGPWFWLFEQLGVPDWIAHRLWIATLLFAAGAGVRWGARVLGLAPAAALVAAVVYQLSPYVLPYISRTSVLLPPWAGLGWLVGLTALAARRRLLPYLGAIGLLIATIGGINATAMVMIAPAPVIWLIDAAARREVSWRRTIGVAGAIGAVSLAVSLWWLAGLRVQGKYGAEALAYSEALESTAHTSSAPEAMRGLGYWLFYVRDQVTTLTSASTPYQESGWVFAAGWSLVLLGAAGIGFFSWRARRFAACAALTGLVLAVGAFPFDDPSPLAAPLTERSRDTVVLALRSSTRAAPLVVLALALGAGVVASAVASRLRAHRWWPGLAVAGIAAANLPALWTGAYVDPALLRPDPLPDAWTELADHLDTTGDARVLLLPGMESAAYRWGYTVDPPLPGLTGKPLVTRDWLPLGSPAAMDLLYALDDRFQAGIAEPDAIAPVARLLGADTVVVANDTQFERFPTVRPEPVWEMYQAGVDGLSDWLTFGDAAANEPVVPMLDETALLHDSVGAALPQLAAARVADAAGIGRAASAAVVVSGSGDGIVDAAVAGVLDGSEVVVYSASLGGEELARALAEAPVVVVTDSNRVRAHHWRSSREVTGFTEDDRTTALLERDPFDHRLPVFESPHADQQTLTLQDGVVATASTYGTPLSYWPEVRPAMAVDGDPTTAWVVAERADPTGERLHLSAPEKVTEVTLLQPDAGPAGRTIEAVRIFSGDGAFDLDVALDATSRVAPGQIVVLPSAASELEIVISRVGAPAALHRWGWGSVGFAEVSMGLAPTTETTRLPRDASAATPAGTPLVYVMSRLRTGAESRWRGDPERSMTREIEVPQDRVFEVDLTVRLSPRASDAVLAELAGADLAVADARLVGSGAVAGLAAFDGDDSTAWITPFDANSPATVVVPSDGTPVDGLEILTRTGAGYARPTELTVEAGGLRRVVALDPEGPDRQTVRFEPVAGEELSVAVTASDGATTIDRRTNLPVGLPVGVAELVVPGVVAAPLPPRLDTGCRDDLVSIDGRPFAVRVSASWDQLLAGAEAEVTACGDSAIDLAAGTHVVSTAAGLDTGLDVDRVVLADADAAGRGAATPIAVERSTSRTSRTFEVAACPEGCWLVQGEGFADGWEATVDGEVLNDRAITDGAMNGWWLPPSTKARTVELRWTPQRSMWIAFAVSVLAVLACVAFVAVGAIGWSRARRARVDELDRSSDPASVAGLGEAASSYGAALPVPTWFAAVAALVVAGLAVGPAAGVAAGAIVALARVTRRWWIAPAVAVALLAAAGLYIGRGVVGHGVRAGFDWPLEFQRAHVPTLVALVVLAASTLGVRRGAAE